MQLTAPSAVNIPEGKYGIARKINIILNPFLPLNSSAFFRYLDLAINFSAEERKNMTRFVSALKLQEGKNLGSNQKFAK